MKLKGTILKMNTNLNNVVEYFLPIGNELINMNPLINKQISFDFTDEIYCISCWNQTPKSFAQGFCYKCFISAPETEDCVLRPELCQAHLGIARDMGWAKEHCMQDHFVYLALSSEVKVGVTRKSQIPTRWIDQGAHKAIKLSVTPYRQLAGLIEVELKKHFTDKTAWQKMLKNQLADNIDLIEEKQKAWSLLPDDLKSYVIDDDEIVHINYPVSQFPQKVKSVSFDNQMNVSGKLTGIKGQYLIFEDGSVLNIRKHNGYVLEINY